MAVSEPAGADKISTREVIAGIDDWLKSNESSVPEVVKLALRNYSDLVATLDAKSAAMRKILAELRKSFGITPKSEKTNNYGRGKSAKRKRLEDQLVSNSLKVRKHESMARKYRQKVENIKYEL